MSWSRICKKKERGQKGEKKRALEEQMEGNKEENHPNSRSVIMKERQVSQQKERDLQRVEKKVKVKEKEKMCKNMKMKDTDTTKKIEETQKI